MSKTPEAPHQLMEQLLQAEITSVVNSATAQRGLYSDRNIRNEHDPHFTTFDIPITGELTEKDTATALTEKLHQEWGATELFEVQEGGWKRVYWQSWDKSTF